MNIRKLAAILFFLCFSCGRDSCPSQGTLRDWLTDNGKPKILCTTAMIADLVKGVGGDRIDLITLIEGELDPHSYQLVKGDDEKLTFADIIFFNGLGLEHGPSLQHYLENSSKGVSLGQALLEKDPKKIINLQDQLDPHIWMDAGLWSETIPTIVAHLKKLDQEHAADYEENGKKYAADLKIIDQEILEIIQKIPAQNRYLVTSHDAFSYFAKAYLVDKNRQDDHWQERFYAPEGLSPESQLSTLDIQRTLDFIQLHNIHVIFPESNVNKDSLRKIVEVGNEKKFNLKMSQDPLYGDAMEKTPCGTGTYKAMMHYNANTLYKYLK